MRKSEERCSGQESRQGAQDALLEVCGQDLNPGETTMFRCFPLCILTLWVENLEDIGPTGVLISDGSLVRA